MEYTLRRKELSRNWYMKVIVEPSLEKIQFFFDNVHTTYETSANTLLNSPELGYVDLLTEEIRKFHKVRRKFEFDVILTIQSTNPEIAEHVMELVRTIDDIYIKALDSKQFSPEEIATFQNNTMTYKARLLNALFIPLRQKLKVNILAKYKKWILAFGVKYKRIILTCLTIVGASKNAR